MFSLILLVGLLIIKEVSTNKVVGGTDALEGAAPYQISIQYKGRHDCGGVIIHKSFVLTAGHCIYKRNVTEMRVAAGSNDLRNGSQLFQVDKLIIHSRYFKPSYHNDIGLVRLSKPLKFDGSTKMINLMKNAMPVNSSVTLTGFGRLGSSAPPSDKLQTIDLRVISNEDCRKLYGNLSEIVGGGHFCTLNGKSEGACSGDSGSPLTFKGQLAGVVNAGIPCAEGYPDIHGRVSFFYEWIMASIRKNMA